MSFWMAVYPETPACMAVSIAIMLTAVLTVALAVELLSLFV
jgi:hypothetical protein